MKVLILNFRIHFFIFVLLISKIANGLSSSANQLGSGVGPNDSSRSAIYHVGRNFEFERNYTPPISEKEIKEGIISYLRKISNNFSFFNASSDDTLAITEDLISKISDINITFIPPSVEVVSIENGQIRGDCRYTMGSGLKSIECTGSLFEQFPEFNSLSPKAVSFFLHEILGALGYDDFNFQITSLLYLYSNEQFKNYLPSKIELKNKLSSDSIKKRNLLQLADGGSTIGSGGGEYFLFKLKILILEEIFKKELDNKSRTWYNKSSKYIDAIVNSSISYKTIVEPLDFIPNLSEFPDANSIITPFLKLNDEGAPLSQPVYFETIDFVNQVFHIKVIEPQWSAYNYLENVFKRNLSEDELLWKMAEIRADKKMEASKAQLAFEEYKKLIRNKIELGIITDDSAKFIVMYTIHFPKLVLKIRANNNKPNFVFTDFVIKELLHSLDTKLNNFK